ncbi:MAG TPA: SCO family protein [Allosphingosinicella sp.]|nr:SCO family protein [Allosphingosinicella sp.]
MNESAMNRLSVLLLTIFALMLSACDQPVGDPPLKGATMGGPFTLTSHQGRRVSDTDFSGQYRLVYFGYSFCPDVCPVDLQTLSAGLRQFEAEEAEKAAKVQPIFITVDPRRDTVEALAHYVTAFHPRLIALTGSDEEIARTARAFAISYQAQPPATPGGEYLVDHMRIFVLYGPEGEPLAIVPHDEGPAGVAAELRKWVR